MKYLFLFIFTMLSTLSFSQYPFEASTAFPFGKINPNAPEELKEMAPLIGICDCASRARNNFPDTSWKAPQQIIWSFKYIMNGMAIQDETLKPDGIHSGSIRQYNQDSSQWYVHYYSNGAATPKLSSWAGSKTADGKIVLYKEQNAPNGTIGFYKITFHDINKDGFKWLGQWVNEDESIQYPTWRIDCKKRH